MAKSTISAFFKNKEAIKAADAVKGVTTACSKQRPQIMDEVEKLLLVLIKENELAGDSMSEGINCEKALQACNELLQKSQSTSVEGESGSTLKANRYWSEELNHRCGIHSVASSNKEAAEKYSNEFRDFVNVEYLPSKCLTVTRLPYYAKNCQREKSLPKHKSMKDRITAV